MRRGSCQLADRRSSEKLLWGCSLATIGRLQILQAHWERLSDVERGQIIVLLRAEMGVRQLARFLPCSEGLVRHLEIVGKLPAFVKQAIVEGRCSARKAVAWYRQQRAGTG